MRCLHDSQTCRYRLGTPFVSGLQQKANRARGKRVPNLDEAFRMLDTFASVGVTHFDLTHIDIDGEKRGFRPQQSLAQLKNSLPKLFPGAKHGTITSSSGRIAAKRSSCSSMTSTQAALSRVGEAAFLTLQTSPGNHQAWIAVSGTG